ncbi:MAG: hypothetical protein JNK82_04300 [Myxococcaceae bacterium]|nr:hypothetical protein [Myxococcaceae bacterium]
MLWPEVTKDELKQSSASLEEGTHEWEVAWAALSKKTGDWDREAYCPLSHESWQYLCSFRDRGRWVHEFRHRHHPLKQRRWYVHVPASEGWAPAH